ncbi:TPA: pheA operon leader peptide PheL [Escherichia coli]|nr:hypothetical protein [Escherichia coli]
MKHIPFFFALFFTFP